MFVIVIINLNILWNSVPYRGMRVLLVDVVTIGETMVLFEPFESGLIQYSESFRKRIGGAESNFAIGLSKLGHSALWVSRLGDDPFGRYIQSFLRGEGVNVIAKNDKKASTGLFFKQTGGYKHASIYYFRKGSAASFLSPADIPVEKIKESKYLHVTGITPALSESAREAILYAIEVAKEHGVKVIFDPNIRQKLWDSSIYRPVLLQILAKADIFLPGEEEIKLLFPGQKLEKVIADILQMGIEIVVVKKGRQGAAYYTLAKEGHIKGYPNEYVVDPVGAGDAFAAGFISGLLNGKNIEESVDKGNLIGSMVTMVNGDCEGLPTEEDIKVFRSNESDVTR